MFWTPPVQNIPILAATLNTANVPPSSAPVPAAARPRGLSQFIRRLYSSSSSAFGATVVIFFLIVAVAGPLIAPYGENEQVFADARQPPSAQHWFGVDRLGRDVFSRVLLGTRDIFSLAGLGTLLAVASGSAVGLFSGYVGGWVDEGVMRFFDSLLAMPALLLALLLLGTIGQSRQGILVVIVVVYTPIVARVVRSVVLGVKNKAFVEAARTQGEPLREILPSVLPALAVEGALRFSYAIFLVASLGFLGVGVQPPEPDWGLMVNEARQNVAQTPWALYFPAAAIALLVVGVNLMADGLKRVLQEEDNV
jgi:peptide/nickel transport system permease protein